jgi:hypothetical protein
LEIEHGEPEHEAQRGQRRAVHHVRGGRDHVATYQEPRAHRAGWLGDVRLGRAEAVVKSVRYGEQAGRAVVVVHDLGADEHAHDAVGVVADALVGDLVQVASVVAAVDRLGRRARPGGRHGPVGFSRHGAGRVRGRGHRAGRRMLIRRQARAPGVGGCPLGLVLRHAHQDPLSLLPAGIGPNALQIGRSCAAAVRLR